MPPFAACWINVAMAMLAHLVMREGLEGMDGKGGQRPRLSNCLSNNLKRKQVCNSSITLGVGNMEGINLEVNVSTITSFQRLDNCSIEEDCFENQDRVAPTPNNFSVVSSIRH